MRYDNLRYILANRGVASLPSMGGAYSIPAQPKVTGNVLNIEY